MMALLRSKADGRQGGYEFVSKALGRSFFDGAARAETQAHRSDGQRARGFAYATCCALHTLVARQGKGRGIGIAYCLRTADKAPDKNIGGFSFL
jgi:hypothetical protein